MRIPILVIGFLAVPLAGCAVTASVESRNEYQVSAANYKKCLLANPATLQNCEGLRLAMETDERKYNELTAGMNRRF